MEMDFPEISKKWRERSFTCNLWIDPPGQAWIDFVHDVDELLILVKGELELTMEGRTLRPVIGEEILIPAGAKHTIRNVGTTENHWLYGYRTIN